LGIAAGENFAEAAFAVFFAHELAFAFGVKGETGEVIGHTGFDLHRQREVGLGCLTRLVRAALKAQLGNKISRFYRQ
jgi:hypothetical protein